MNAMPPPTATKPRLGSPVLWALSGTREHLDDWTRVHSIIMSLSSALQGEIDRADAEKEGMETGFAEEFIKNLDWLMDSMNDRRGILRKDLDAVAGERL
jgi:hypothetical protein